MRLRLLAIPLAGLLAGAICANAADASFDRTLNFKGRLDLTVATGAGSIHLVPGPAGQIHITGQIRTSWGADETRVKELVAHPPIEQTGSIVKIGANLHNLQGISISYEIQAPSDAFLKASSGSGSITDDGMGADAHLSTGSGTIHATGLSGGLDASTGSGNIYAELTGSGNDKVETGSGSIELRNVHGGMHARTGSGSIKISGTPSAAWNAETGSGSIEASTGGAAFTLDASTGSGGIDCDRAVSGPSSTDRHHLAGNVNGGGPEVRLDTGSGSIHIH